MAFNQGRKVRVIAKIRAFTDLESMSGGDGLSTKKVVSVHKPNGEESEPVSISFGDQSAGSKESSYEMDHCYNQNEKNGLIFSKEVKPLISEVFDGYNATVIAYGARGSGKTHLIQGSEEEPGLAFLAVDEILSLAEKHEKLISISLYEICGDKIHDILISGSSTVSKVEVSQSKIHQKGLSQVTVKSYSEFWKYFNVHKEKQKKTAETSCKLHKGLIIHVSSNSEKSDVLVGKMNFVDLAGYEDSRKKSVDARALAENVKMNKSIYALQNVLSALNANQSHVPYRDSKLTHLLQDSLGGVNKVLIVTCLAPYVCQDSIYIVSLASRYSQGTNRAVLDSTKKIKSATKLMVLASQKNQISGSVSGNKLTGARIQLSGKKAKACNTVSNAKGSVSTMKGRKLFDESNRSTKSENKSKKGSSPLNFVSTTEISSLEEKSASNLAKEVVPLAVELSPSAVIDVQNTTIAGKELSSLAVLDVQETTMQDKEISSSAVLDVQEITIPDKVSMPGKENIEKVAHDIIKSPKDLSFEKGPDIEKKDTDLLVSEARSPPISARLQQISNNLKMLLSSTPSCIEPNNNVSSDAIVSTYIVMPKTPEQNVESDDENNDVLSDALVSADILEPKTPQQNVKTDNKGEISIMSSSRWQTFSARSSQVKNSLVQEYLRFLNTASREDLKRLKGIGEKRATYILELREESPEPFKNIDDLKDIGLSAKQIKGIMRKELGELYN
ncbi:kinesin-like protein KIN-10C isoform X2 [Carica papaya]|uniref:kinesin-like protein KIN-10C isoform X2 n=1 Tax=Carica papaya TaxID=3649 RepID=UPI000B8CF8FF|nr:kinesin-like protein KIN-10C isoform X2 [Carica papaya]